MKLRGFTLLEALTVLAITAILMAILIPVLSAAKRSAVITDSVQRVRQLYLDLQLYRSDNNGNDSSFDSYYGLALPPRAWARDQLLTTKERTYRSPCGENRSAFQSSGFSVFLGHIDPVYALADPVLGPTQAKEFRGYLTAYRESAPLLIDINCNDVGARLDDPYAKKRGIAVLFSGQIINKLDQGFASRLKWYVPDP